MLKNYFKIAIAVLKRRKFFTFISLFGISFTLTILIVATALTEKVISPDYPDYKRERSLYLEKIEIRNSKEGWMNSSNVSIHFLEHYVASLKNLEKLGISSRGNSSNAYVNNKKLVLNYQYTNAAYWDILEYKFLEGKSFGQKEIDNAEKVAVISKETKEAYFGDEKSVVGKYISADNINYSVIGVFENVSQTIRNFSGNMYLPYSISKEKGNNTDLMGSYNAILLAKSIADLPKLQKEFDQMIKKVPIPKDFDKLYSNADPFFIGLSRRIGGSSTDAAVTKVISLATIVVLLFLLLPTINLVNINITRIMERSSEIGVRKAFGASSKTLVYQFMVENMILTFIGGLIGFILSLLVIYTINETNFVSNIRLSMNFIVLCYCLLACIFFGLLSGVYPAWRMSKMNVVKALKA